MWPNATKIPVEAKKIKDSDRRVFIEVTIWKRKIAEEWWTLL